jgi:hypothetical protein
VALGLVAACGAASDDTTGAPPSTTTTIARAIYWPGPVTSITVDTSGSQVSLSWVAPVDDGGSAITDYVIKVRPYEDPDGFVYPDGISTATAATVSGLTRAHLYYFRIYAVNARGMGLEGSVVSGHPEMGVARSTERVTTTSGESGLVRSLSRETSCEVLDAEWFTADALADLARETFGRSSENYQVAKTYKSAISNRMDQLGC